MARFALTRFIDILPNRSVVKCDSFYSQNETMVDLVRMIVAASERNFIKVRWYSSSVIHKLTNQSVNQSINQSFSHQQCVTGYLHQSSGRARRPPARPSTQNGLQIKRERSSLTWLQCHVKGHTKNGF